MVKFKIKRKITDAKARFLKRKAKRYDIVIIKDSVNGSNTVFTPKNKSSFYFNKISVHKGLYKRIYNKNKPVGRKYPLTVYEIENKKCSVYEAARMINFLKKEKNKNSGKLQRIYKLFPELSPEGKRQKQHEQEVLIWKEKLKMNELCQSLNSL